MRKLIVAGVSAALLGLGLPAFASASAHSTGGQTLRFTDQTTQFASIDLPPAGFGQGDEVVFHDQLVRDGAVIGHDGGSCQATFVANRQAPQFQCLITFVFGAGQITAQGLFDIANPASFTGNLAVTGGTGVYQLARGQGTVQQTSATVATITLSIAA